MPSPAPHLPLALLLAATAHAGALHAAASGGVSVHIGPTTIPEGTAQGAQDITLSNERLAVAFAVSTAAPWGVPRGGIVDVAEVRNGVIAPDRASLVDFMPNDWSGWPTTYQRVTIEKNTPAEVIVRTERDWENVALVTTWQLKAGEDTVRMQTRMHNRGATSYAELLTGYVLWPEGGYLFGVPGAHEQESGKVKHPLAHWSAAYDREWMMGLHAPFADRVNDDARDRYLRHSLAPGETRAFEAWLQVGPRGELAPLVAAEIAREALPAGRISGRVRTTDGRNVESPAVVVEKAGADGAQPYTWTIGEQGRYSLQLPAGRYRIYATAQAYSDSSTHEIELGANESLPLDFDDLRPPGELTIKVLASGSTTPLDARISIDSGQAPLIRYFGKTTFFTELERVGQATLVLAPGDYRFKIDSGAGFRAPYLYLNARLAPGGRQSLQAPVAVSADPAASGWYGGDLHHHSDVLDGFTEPHYVLRSELAAGLDLTFLSDHDSVANNREMQRLAATRGVPFMPASEFSPSWAHFNAYPLDMDKTIDIDVGRSTVQQIFAEARRMGARVIAANHPFINYGYFRSQQQNAIPGGYSAEFDLIEINGSEANEQTVERAWSLWNAGQKAYLTAGSDAHDVWKEVSGAARMYVRLPGGLDPLRFVDALKSGNAYASQGPLVFTEHAFGSTLRHAAGTPLRLDFELQAVNDLASVQLIERGKPVEERSFQGTVERVPVRFAVKPAGSTWYSLVVKDSRGRQAWTNPLWVEPSGT